MKKKRHEPKKEFVNKGHYTRKLKVNTTNVNNEYCPNLKCLIIKEVVKSLEKKKGLYSTTFSTNKIINRCSTFRARYVILIKKN